MIYYFGIFHSFWFKKKIYKTSFISLFFIYETHSHSTEVFENNFTYSIYNPQTNILSKFLVSKKNTSKICSNDFEIAVYNALLKWVIA